MHEGMKAWKSDKAALRNFLSYEDLPEQPVVLDIGGFEGGWSDGVRVARPNAIIHIFEPHPVFAEDLRKKFRETPGIHIHEFAIGKSRGRLSLSDDGDASSAFGTSGPQSYDAEIRPVDEFFNATDLGQIDLVKINIEGGEYDLVPAMIDCGAIRQIERLQVQFHLFDPSLVAQRDAIRARLSDTHTCTWCYPFVWEEWQLK